VRVYLDLAKAFDTVNHDRLIQKLKEVGIGGSLLAWFTSYLYCWKHKVKIDGLLSDELEMGYGVPQGSVLGPILFIFYINDLYQLPLTGKITGYADDTSLLYTAATKEEVEQSFKKDAEVLRVWFQINQLHLNYQKCMYIVYAYNTPGWVNDIYFKIGNEEMQRVEIVKYLGLLIDNKLTWKRNTIAMQTKLRKLNYLFYHLKNHFNQKHLKALYSPLYESVMSVGIIHWGGSAHTNPIKVLQNKVCRSIVSLPPKTSKDIMYPQMEKWSLDKLYKYRLLMFVFKNKGLFHITDSHSKSRFSGGLVAAYPGWRKHHSRLQARYMGTENFNKLSKQTRNEQKLGLCKRGIREKLKTIK